MDHTSYAVLRTTSGRLMLVHKTCGDAVTVEAPVTWTLSEMLALCTRHHHRCPALVSLR